MTVFDFILERGVFAVIRLGDLGQAISLAEALAEGGIRGIEFTLTNRQALEVIAPVQDRLNGAAVAGMGTITDVASAREAIAAGARFLVTPMLEADVVAAAASAGVPVMVGAFTPTEIYAAWRWRADLVKVFPARLGGATYFKDVLAPLPQLRLVPSGGVDLSSVAAYIKAGAAGVAVGGALTDETLIHRRAWTEIGARARAFVEAVARARAELQAT